MWTRLYRHRLYRYLPITVIVGSVLFSLVSPVGLAFFLIGCGVVLAIDRTQTS